MSVVETEIRPSSRPVPRWVSLRNGLFGSKTNTVITILVLLAAVWIIPPLVRWLFIDATWLGSAEACAGRSGACWAFISAKLGFITFGFYPPTEHWRPLSAIVLIFGLLILTGMPAFWRRQLVYVWIGTISLVIALMAGTFSGTSISTGQWGGLALTLLLSVVTFASAFPLAILLALGRRTDMVIVRTLCIAFIECVRGVPMIVVLYFTMLLLPLMLFNGWSLDKLLRIQLGMSYFFAAYLAEILRAGLQALPNGQTEAARSLGLGYGMTMRLIILPQVLRSTIPALVTLAIGIFQNTSLVAVVGIFDLLNAARAAATDPQWIGFYDEAYVFAGVIYFALCFCASRYSLWLERHLQYVA